MNSTPNPRPPTPSEQRAPANDSFATLEGEEEVIHRVCVVIPMYRTAPYIESVIREIPAWVWRIIAVDDASPDDCAEKVLNLHDPRVVLIRHAKNQGVGGAMLTGYNRALEMGASLVVKMDGDGQMPVEYLENLILPILNGQADYTKGNRFYHTEEILQMPFIRRVGNLGLSFLTKMATGYWNVFDPTNGYTALWMATFRLVNQKHIQPRYFFETSMLFELSLIRAAVVDVPIPARYAGEVSSLSAWKSLFEFAYYLFRGALHRYWIAYFVMDFSVASLYFMCGLPLTLFGVIWGAYFWNQSILTRIPATTGTVMIAVLSIILGFQLLLQAFAYDVQNVPKEVFPRRLRRKPSSTSHISKE